MVLAAELLTDVQSLINTHGEILRIRKFTRTLNTGSFDDEILLTSGVDTWGSGLIQSLGWNDNVLIQQGLLFKDDLKCYVDGSVNLSGTWKLGLGSPTVNEYALASNNMVESPQINGSIVYQKVFLRRLTTGSLFGE